MQPVRILVLTYNRTLRGYIQELADSQIPEGTDLDLEVSTFGKWARDQAPSATFAPEPVARSLQLRWGDQLKLHPTFLIDEVDYVLGRFSPESLSEYLVCKRVQRGLSPRVDRTMRERLLEEVIYPYGEWKARSGLWDWNDFALNATTADEPSYDVIIVDEAQDFSANQVRAILAHLAADHSITFVMDAAQRIYPRHFLWSEVGLNLRPSQVFRLSENHRNTIEIAAFVRPLIEGIELDADGTLPDMSAASTHGVKPIVLEGRFSRQMDYTIQRLKSIDLSKESVAFLHPKGGGWFDEVRNRLSQAGIRFVEISQKNEWPRGPVNVALSTLHSGKGLEFDHVFMLGLNHEVTPAGEGPSDSLLDNTRRLVAMGAGRARKSVVIGYRPDDVSGVVAFIDPTTCNYVTL